MFFENRDLGDHSGVAFLLSEEVRGLIFVLLVLIAMQALVFQPENLIVFARVRSVLC